MDKEKFALKARSYVEDLFGVNTDSRLMDMPDNWDPLDEIAADSEFDLSNLMSKAVDPSTGMPRDVRLPEGDFKEAANYFDFCANFTGTDFRFPFARQMWAVLTLLAEYCPKCSHPKLIGSPDKIPVGIDARKLQEKMQLLNYGVCPKCKATKHELWQSGHLNIYREAVWRWGQRSGKSTVTGSLSNYVTHKYLMFPKMSTVCRGIQASTPLTATFVGLRFADAFALLWDPVVKGFADSPWFTSYNEMLLDYGKRLGIEFVRIKDSYIRYGHKNIELYPAGPSKRALRGRTRILSAIDELGWFPMGQENKDQERADADEVHKALDRSLLTVRNEVRRLYEQGYNSFIPGLAINISSPSDETDKISRLYHEHQNDRAVLALSFATWDINPLYTRETEEIAAAFKKDPVEAMRDYGAVPPLNAKTFMDMTVAGRSFNGPNRATLAFRQAEINGRQRRAGKVETTNPMQPMPASVMAIDAGYSNNSFAVVIEHLNQIKREDGTTSTTVVVPVLAEIQTRQNVVLHYSAIYKHVLCPLIKAFNCRYLFADRWNSRSILDQAAEDFAGIELISEQYSVKYRDFMTTRSYVEEGRMLLPKLEMPFEDLRKIDNYPSYFEGKPASHLLFQMGTVRDVGTTVIKGGVYTDDLFRALVLGTSRILDPKIMPEIIRMSAVTTRGPMVGALVMGRAMGMQGSPMHGKMTMTSVAGRSSGLGQGAGLPGNQASLVVRGSRPY